MKPLIILALETGMRRSELLRLKHEDWDKHTGLINIKETKNGRCRVIPASNRARQTLCKLAQSNAHSLIPISGNAVNLSFQRLKRRTGLNWLRFHDLRHEALSRLLEFGLNIAEVKLISGHSELRQLQTYVTVDAENLRRKMSGQHFETK